MKDKRHIISFSPPNPLIHSKHWLIVFFIKRCLKMFILVELAHHDDMATSNF